MGVFQKHASSFKAMMPHLPLLRRFGRRRRPHDTSNDSNEARRPFSRGYSLRSCAVSIMQAPQPSSPVALVSPENRGNLPRPLPEIPISDSEPIVLVSKYGLMVDTAKLEERYAESAFVPDWPQWMLERSYGIPAGALDHGPQVFALHHQDADNHNECAPAWLGLWDREELPVVRWMDHPFAGDDPNPYESHLNVSDVCPFDSAFAWFRLPISPEEAAELADLAAQRRPQIINCAVCGDDKPKAEFPPFTATVYCVHEPSTCTECLQTWIASEFASKGTTDFCCPECPEHLTFEDVRFAASPGTFAAYDALTTRQALSADPDFAWCLAPNCGAGQLNPDGGTYMKCGSCGYEQCTHHATRWHAGETCVAWDARHAAAVVAERATTSVLDSVSRLCPNPVCGWRIQKASGCDHMHCRQCGHQFCFECGAAQARIRAIGNEAHDKSCQYFSHHLDVAWPFNYH